VIKLDDIDIKYAWKFISIIFIFGCLIIGLVAIMPDSLKPENAYEQQMLELDVNLYMLYQHQKLHQK